MRGYWLGCGWKMNKVVSEACAYAEALKRYVQTNGSTLHLFIVPPFTALREVGRILTDTPIVMGAQNIHWEDSGPFTGEISPLMVKDTGVKIVELGHSERRKWFGETDLTVNWKVLAAIRYGLRPLICVGETSAEKEAGCSDEFVINQIKSALKDVPSEAMSSVMIAYEPVWAIGESGTPASPQYASHIIHTIRSAVAELYSRAISSNLPILYGGSVNVNNAADYIQQPDIDGLFVGRAGWNIDSFIELIKILESSIE
jgi:triosephosphate isomerase